MEVNVHHAKTNLSKLIAAVESGEEVVIARNGKPAVKLVSAYPVEKQRGRRREAMGAWEGLVMAPTEEQWEKIHQEFVDGMRDFSKVEGGGA